MELQILSFYQQRAAVAIMSEELADGAFVAGQTG
jgi:hypothetical protein